MSGHPSALIHYIHTPFTFQPICYLRPNPPSSHIWAYFFILGCLWTYCLFHKIIHSVRPSRPYFTSKTRSRYRHGRFCHFTVPPPCTEPLSPCSSFVWAKGVGEEELLYLLILNFVSLPLAALYGSTHSYVDLLFICYCYPSPRAWPGFCLFCCYQPSCVIS